MLKPYPDEGMTFWPVDRHVGNVRNDSPDLFRAFERTALATGANGANRDNCNRPAS